MNFHAEGVGIALESVKSGRRAVVIFQAAQVGFGDAGAGGKVGKGEVLLKTPRFEGGDERTKGLVLGESPAGARLDRRLLVRIHLLAKGREGAKRRCVPFSRLLGVGVCVRVGRDFRFAGYAGP